MNENLNLVEILEGCPKETKFYSTIYGEVKFACIEHGIYPVNFITKSNNFISYAPNGSYIKSHECECTIFPSKYQRDWSKFERFWDKPKVERFDPKTLQPFDKVLVRDINTSNWYVDFFSDFNNQGEFICIGGCHWAMGIPYNENTKHLVGTTKYCPEYYKWWEK